MTDYRIRENWHKWMETVRKGLEQGRKQGARELKLMEKGIEKLKLNHRAGKFIKKREHSEPYRYYARELGTEPVALWRLNVHPKWRLIYITTSDSGSEEEAKINPAYCIIVDFLDHNQYNKIFGYPG